MQKCLQGLRRGIQAIRSVLRFKEQYEAADDSLLS